MRAKLNRRWDEAGAGWKAPFVRPARRAAAVVWYPEPACHHKHGNCVYTQQPVGNHARTVRANTDMVTVPALLLVEMVWHKERIERIDCPW